MASSSNTDTTKPFSARPISQFPLLVLPTPSAVNHEGTEGFVQRERPYGERALPLSETDQLRMAKPKPRNIKSRLGGFFRKIFHRTPKSRLPPSSLAKETSDMDTAAEQAFLTQGRRSPTKVLPIPPPIGRMHNTVKRMMRPSKEVLLPPKPVL